MNDLIMKMFDDYCNERGCGSRIYCTDFGFVLYQLHENECFIEDLYVAPPFRNQGFAPKLLLEPVLELAKSLGISVVSAQVYKPALNSRFSRKFVLNFGGELYSETEDTEWYVKEI